MWQHAQNIADNKLLHTVCFHVQSRSRDQSGGEKQSGNEENTVDFMAQADADGKESKGGKANHVQARFQFGEQQQKGQKSTDETGQKKEEKLRKPCHGNAFINENGGERHLHDQWDFTLVQVRQHDVVCFPKGAQQIKKSNRQEKGDDDDLKNEQQALRFGKISVHKKQIHQCAEQRDKNWVEKIREKREYSFQVFFYKYSKTSVTKRQSGFPDRLKR